MNETLRIDLLEKEVELLRKEVERLRYLIPFGERHPPSYNPMPTIPMPGTGNPIPVHPYTISCQQK